MLFYVCNRLKNVLEKAKTLYTFDSLNSFEKLVKELL